MGHLDNGVWRQDSADWRIKNGKYNRAETQFRNWVTADGSPGPTGEGGFAAEPGRYHLYVSWACPWAHRTLIMRKLKGLEDAISLSATHWHMAENGWTFEPGPGVIPDEVNGASYVHQIYTKADPRYTGRASVPILWDKQRETIVSNESSEIIRMFNSAFARFSNNAPDYFPEPLQGEIEEVNDVVYNNVNNGVYRCGFARTQEAYDEAFDSLFSTLDKLEDRLSTRRYLCGGEVTEADWRLLPTLLRFDPVYYCHFKCNLRMIEDYQSLSNYMRDLYQHPGISETVNFEHNKRHYYTSHESVNPLGIVPIGPELDFDRPHDRDRLG